MSSADNTLRPRNSAGSAAGAGGPAGAGAAGSAAGADPDAGTAGGSSGFSARARAAARAAAGIEDENEDDEDGALEAEGESYIEETDWQRVGIFGAGLAIGALLGAGAALLLAPQSGAETRDMIVTRVRRVRDRAGDTWGDLGDELRRAARRGRKRVRRGMTRTRWKAADAIDRD